LKGNNNHLHVLTEEEKGMVLSADVLEQIEKEEAQEEEVFQLLVQAISHRANSKCIKLRALI
jgi:hypothetical protein